MRSVFEKEKELSELGWKEETPFPRERARKGKTVRPRERKREGQRMTLASQEGKK